jgi:hypothetical protein
MKGITTLCGSVRFKEAFDTVNKELTLAGWIVLQPGVWEHEKLHAQDAQMALIKDELDSLHHEKILMSDSVVIINVCGYIGKSTFSELLYARKQGKDVFWLNHNDNEKSWRQMLK